MCIMHVTRTFFEVRTQQVDIIFEGAFSFRKNSRVLKSCSLIISVSKVHNLPPFHWSLKSLKTIVQILKHCKLVGLTVKNLDVLYFTMYSFNFRTFLDWMFGKHIMITHENINSTSERISTHCALGASTKNGGKSFRREYVLCIIRWE